MRSDPARLRCQSRNPMIGYWGYIGIMEKKMETTTLYRDYVGDILGYIGIMEKKMEIIIIGM